MKCSTLWVFAAVIFILTIGVVSAQDLNQTDQLSIDDGVGDSILQQNDETFTDLNNTISTAESQIDINSDYTFNQSTDEQCKKGIVINSKNLIINGNGHLIDAKSQARIFTINASNITINNLILRNANDSAIFFTNSILTTNNVTFENNFAKNGGAVNGEKSNFTSVNDKFTDNYAKKFGSAISLDDNSTFYLVGGSFKSQKDLQWGLIDLTACQFRISNTTFNDVKSKYSSAFHIEKSNGIIQNCDFFNLYANRSAGAICFAEIDKSVTIDNCTFNNITSNNNAGAVLFISDEANPFSDAKMGEISGSCIIKNSRFKDCYSQFGGAVMQLDGILKMENCNFTNNAAMYMGAGIYLAYVNATLNNVDFHENGIIYPIEDYNSGGAIFSDIGTLNINSANFIDNYALTGSAISLYECNYTISNSNFKGNRTNYIHSVFDKKTSIDDSNNFSDADNKINLTDFVYVVEGWGKQINYTPIVLDEKLVNESYFNLVDYGLVTSVKNQGWAGCCWAFGSAAALESAFLKATNKTLLLDISENNIKNTALKYYFYGVDSMEAASHSVGAANFIGWLGVVNAEDDAYDELGRISAVLSSEYKYHVYDYVALPAYKVSLINDYKAFLVKYGALSVAVHGADGGTSGDYNETTYGAYYISDGTFTIADHAVTLVGWNDTYSKTNFNKEAPGDGAWIIKNSWGADWGDNGYYYVSYYDQRFSSVGQFAAIGYIVNNDHNYEKVYEYDIISYVGLHNGHKKGNLTHEEELRLLNESFTKFQEYQDSLITSTVAYANVFESIDDDLIVAVGTYFNSSNVDYSIAISVNDKIVHTQNGKSSWRGYETIKLDKCISIKKGDMFKINITSNQVPIGNSRLKVKTGMSITNMTGGIWGSPEALAGTVVCIKAYTIPKSEITLKVSNVNVVYGNSAKVTVTLVSGNVSVVGDSVKVTFNGKTYTGITDKDGKAVLTIPAKVIPKKYTAYAKSGVKTTSFKINVKKATPKLTAKQKTFKKSKKVKNYVIILNNNKGKAMKKVNVYLKVKGKTYKAITNAKGKATFKITKLTKTGTFKAKITYKGSKYYTNAIKTVKIIIKK